MIKTTVINGFRYTVSDSGFYIRQLPTNAIYKDAADLPDASYTYEETDTPIPVLEEVLQ